MRNRLWTIVCAYFLLVLVVSGWSAPGALALLIVGGCVGLVVIFRSRSGHETPVARENCEHCGALFQTRAGLPQRSCAHCGQQRSWVR